MFFITFLKFLFVGAINTLIDFGVLNILMFFSGIEKGWPYALFKAISFSLAVVNSYFLNKNWTFQKKNAFTGNEFSKFFLISFISFCLNVSLATLLVNEGPFFGFSSYLWANFSAVVAAFATTFINFFGYKYLVFKETNRNIS